MQREVGLESQTQILRVEVHATATMNLSKETSLTSIPHILANASDSVVVLRDLTKAVPLLVEGGGWKEGIQMAG